MPEFNYGKQSYLLKDLRTNKLHITLSKKTFQGLICCQKQGLIYLIEM